MPTPRATLALVTILLRLAVGCGDDATISPDAAAGADAPPVAADAAATDARARSALAPGAITLSQAVGGALFVDPSSLKRRRSTPRSATTPTPCRSPSTARLPTARLPSTRSPQLADFTANP
jgi:hypothetical protein